MVEVGQRVDVDQHRRRGEPHREQRHQALSAGEHLRVRRAREQPDGFVERSRAGEREGCRLHLSILTGRGHMTSWLRRRRAPRAAALHQVEVDDHHDRAERDAAQREVVGDLQRHAADAGDEAGGEADQVDRVAEVDPVLHPDLGADQADHAVEHDRDPAEHAARGGAHDRAELRAQAEQDRDHGRDVVGRRRVDPGGTHDADVLGVRRGRRAAERAGQRGGGAVGGDRAAHVGVEVVAGHLGDRLDVPGVLRDQGDHAGEHEQDEGQGEARPVHHGDAVGELAGGEADPVRRLDPGPADPVVVDLLGDAGRQ